MPLPSRCVDYFVILSVAKTKIDASGRFKQRGLPLIEELKYPSIEFKDAEYPSDLGCFAFPDGVSFLTECDISSISNYSFILTEGDGGRIYCSALRYWNEISSDNLQIYCELYDNLVPHTDNNILYEPIIFVIVSHWPFFNEFNKYLNILYNNIVSSTQLKYPIEKSLSSLIYSLPLPPRGRFIVEYYIFGGISIIFSRPSPNQLPLITSKYINILFSKLSLNNILNIIISILCEKRILFYSSHISILTPVIESLCYLIFPFFWQHIYVPILPNKFTDFIYAPMPFICGVLNNYLPDLSLLEGVIFIDLDNNQVKFHSNDPIPKFYRLQQSKILNKLVSNPKKTVNLSTKLNINNIRESFIKFFAKFLKSYKICMNPSTGPSKDKFNKEKWIKQVLNDKNNRDNNREKDIKFLNLFVESQLFQCFIDERYEASDNLINDKNDKNNNVLYFDEKIDEIVNNKSTPFLTDTTFEHNNNNKYTVNEPLDVSDIQSYKAGPYVYNCNLNNCLIPLDDKLFGNILISPILVGDEDLYISQQSMHISWMSIEFFKLKKLYDRHWHSLESRINSQNILFREILNFIMKWQDSNSRYIKSLNNIKLITNTNTNTSTSLNNPWEEFKLYINQYIIKYRNTFNQSSKKSFIPIMESVGSKENTLKVMIETARECESKTAKTKCSVEFANKNLLKYTKKLQDKQLKLNNLQNSNNNINPHAHNNNIPDPRQQIIISSSNNNNNSNNSTSIRKKLDDFITAIEQKDKSSIEHVESTTTFLTNLEIFSNSMPNMIDDVKKISKNRIINFKQYLHDFVNSHYLMHQEFANKLKNIEKLIETIDPEKDIEQFIEGNANKKTNKKNANNNQSLSKNNNQSNFPIKKSNKNINNNDNDDKKDNKNTGNKNNRKQRYSISRELSQIGAKRLTNTNLSIANIQQHLNLDNNRQTLHQQLISQFEALSTKNDVNPVAIDNNNNNNKKLIKQKSFKRQNSSTKKVVATVPPKQQQQQPAAVDIKEDNFSIYTDIHGIDRVSSLLYSDNLWGVSSFEIVTKQCEDGKNIIKNMIKTVEDLCDLWELQSKSLLRCGQSMKLNINLSSSELKCWKELHSLTESSSLLYKLSVSNLRNHIFNLKILKGELKSIIKLLRQKKGSLSSEVTFATKNVQLAYDERNACLRIYRTTQSQWKQLTLTTTYEDELKPLLSQMTIAQLNFKQADMKWDTTKNILRAVKQKEDLCNGVILDIFREKEINRQYLIIKTITHLVIILFNLIYGIHDSLNKFMNLCLQLNVENEINSFIDNEITSSAAMLDKENIRWTAKSVELSWISSKNAIDSAKAMLDYFSTRVSAIEIYSRNINRRSNNLYNNNKLFLSKYGYSLNDLFVYFNKFISSLSQITINFLLSVRTNIEPLLNLVKKSMEKQNISSHQLISECNNDFNKLEEKLAKSVIECRRLETNIDTLKSRITEKENKNKPNNSDVPKKKKRTFKIFEKSKEQLQTELSSTQNKLKQEISNRDRLKAQLQQKSKYRDVLFSKVITDFIRHEEYRLNMNKYIYCIYSKINEESLIRMNKLTKELKNNVSTINIRNNIHKFIKQNRSSYNVPKIILDHVIFKLQQEKNGEIENLFNNIENKINELLIPYNTSNTSAQFIIIFNHNSNLLQQQNNNKNSKNNNKNNKKNKNKNYNNNNNNNNNHIFRKNIVLKYNDTKYKNMELPSLKQVSSNQEISKHLLEYVTRHSMKGGKHARIDSLHSISRSHKHSKSTKSSFKKNNINNTNVKPIDENKEDDDDDNNSKKMSLPPPNDDDIDDDVVNDDNNNNTMMSLPPPPTSDGDDDLDDNNDDNDQPKTSNVQRLQQSLFTTGFKPPPPPSYLKKKKKKKK